MTQHTLQSHTSPAARRRPHRPRRALLMLATAVCVCLSSGCRLAGSSSRWSPPNFATPGLSEPAAEMLAQATRQTAFYRGQNARVVASGTHLVARADPHWPFSLAEMNYAVASREEQRGRERSVDYYYQAAVSSWEYMLAQPGRDTADPRSARATELYQSSVAKLIETGQRFGRLDPRGTLDVNTPSGPLSINMVFTGFAWQPDDFSRLILVGDYASGELSRIHRAVGLGVPVVAIREQVPGDTRGRFLRSQLPFAATAVLRPALHPLSADATATAAATTGVAQPPCLELINPLRVQTTHVAGRQVALASDLTAPLAFTLANPDRARNRLAGFLSPGVSDETAGLTMIEPYQSGKIPVIFVHGLLSDALAWVDVANELRTQAWFVDRYQVWAFGYPTGNPFLQSAARLRADCQEARLAADPQQQDPALSEMVLIGHSMGGLLSKLQVTWSSDTVWRNFAYRPLNTLNLDETARGELARSFYFEPQPFVRRVVFVATPHGGSTWSRRIVGRAASQLVRTQSSNAELHRQLLENNPGAFWPYVESGVPTSIDLLDPESPLLTAMQRLPVSPQVHLHSIIGTGRPMRNGDPADGVVSVSSARHAGVASERLIDTTHTEVHHHPEVIAEIARILQEHTAEFDARKAVEASSAGWRPAEQ